MSMQGWRDFLGADGGGRRLEAALAAGGRVVEETAAPAGWILSDRAGNRVCIASWPDGAEPAPGDEGGSEGA